MADPRWVPSTSNPGIARIDLMGTPSAAGEFRYLLRVPDGFSLATHRHNTDLMAVLLSDEQRVVSSSPTVPCASMCFGRGTAC